MYIIYQFFYIIFLVFYAISFLFKKRKREGIGVRFGNYSDELAQRLAKGKNIWIHAVSVGEVMAAKPLIDRIKEDLGQYDIVISTVTETGNGLAKKIMPKDVVITYLPLDLTCILEKVIKIISPQLFIMMETEIWPNLIRILKKNKVLVVISNGRISDSSFKWYGIIKPIFRNILNCIDLFLMRTKEDAQRIISLGANSEKVKIVGNIKFDSVDFSINKEEKGKWGKLLNIEGKKLIVAGSTHAGEEEILLNTYKQLRDKYNDLCLLIAPRHIERTEEVSKLIKSNGFSLIKISELSMNYELRTTNSVFLLDTIGQLKLFYSFAWTVFVGGSLVKRGGQNMIEPAFYGKPVIFGPHTFNFKDISTAFLNGKGAILVENEPSLIKTLEMLYKDEDLANQIGAQAKNIATSNQGAALKSNQTLKNILQY